MKDKVSRRVFGYLAIICLSILLSGCWDRRELQDRSFVLAAAIDVADAGEQGSQGGAVTRTETFVQPHGAKRYRLSLQVLRLVSGGEGDEKEGEGKTFVLSNTGQSIFEMIRDTLGQSSKSLYFEHIQTIIISEAAVKEAGGLAPILDFFRRDGEARWRIKAYLTSGQAQPLLEYIPPSGEPGGIFLAKMADLHPKNVHVATARADLGYISQHIDAEVDVIMPRIELADNMVKLGGQALFKKDKFAGYLDEYGVKGLRFIYGSEKAAIITAGCPDHPGEILVFELLDQDTKLEPHAEGDNIYFTLDIAMRGNIGEVQCSGHDSTDPDYIRKLEGLFAEEVKRNVLYSLDVCQKLGVDAHRFAGKLKAYKPKIWAKIKDRWDEIYPTVPLVVSVNITIRNIGEHK
ncbi:Ger(x)C family spore germination protein [Sporolituus thermophilus]|uniref:Germination protein, Ger(X)C family n=1 Tax=Sporolituus thermophilus DSM 23256 TaxID=1123285 RepID=A0A1G7IWG3_9FIRM|nr:Ger(x)C family spore germination protein [Sporolituus thermophilus]SDF16894.1 germination protein, Ger(x)C family [Sporolituus thermophilus DSM 23256]